MDYIALFFVIAIACLFVTALKTTTNRQPTICKRHTWVRVDLDSEHSYLKCSVCKLVAGNEPSFEEKEPL